MRNAICGLVLIGLLVAGCGSITPTASNAPTPFPTPLTPREVTDPCGTPPNDTALLVGASDLLAQLTPRYINDTTLQLLAGLPNAPYQLQDEFGYGLPNDRLVNPTFTGQGGMYLAVCNSSPTTPHSIESIDVRTTQATPFTGNLNAWRLCDKPYSSTGVLVAKGCGSGRPKTDAELAASFAPNATVGATVTAAITSVGPSHRSTTSQLALNIPPLRYGSMLVHLDAPTAEGSYAFSFRLHTDDGATPFLANGEVFLLAPAHNWGGTACHTPPLQAQIPSGSDGYFICPQ